MIYKTKKSTPQGTPKKSIHPNIARRIMQELSYGGYVKRYELVANVRATDTAIREAIAELQQAGQPIINMQDGKGYKLAGSIEELAAYKAQERARAEQILKKVNAMRLEG